jgi:Uma2 family endonuclease
MIASRSHRFSVADYYRLAEIGVLRPVHRVELLDGEIYDKAGRSPFHCAVTSELSSLFCLNSRDRWIVSVHNPLRLDEFSEPEPDLMLVRHRDDYYCNQHPGPAVAVLVIEVAETTLEFDRELKLPAYGRAGVPEVWIVNLNELTVEVYREPHFEGYASRTVLRASEQASPAAFPDVSVEIGELLRR